MVDLFHYINRILMVNIEEKWVKSRNWGNDIIQLTISNKQWQQIFK